MEGFVQDQAAILYLDRRALSPAGPGETGGDLPAVIDVRTFGDRLAVESAKNQVGVDRLGGLIDPGRGMTGRFQQRQTRFVPDDIDDADASR